MHGQRARPGADDDRPERQRPHLHLRRARAGDGGRGDDARAAGWMGRCGGSRPPTTRQGNAYLVTSYDAASSGSVVNQVQREFNGLGQTDQRVAGGRRGGEHLDDPERPVRLLVRPVRRDQPQPADVDDVPERPGADVQLRHRAGRPTSAGCRPSPTAAPRWKSYDYLGLGTVVQRGHPQPGVDLTYIKPPASRTATPGTSTSAWTGSAGWSISGGRPARRRPRTGCSTGTTGTGTGCTGRTWSTRRAASCTPTTG